MFLLNKWLSHVQWLLIIPDLKMCFSQAHMIQYTQSPFKPFYGNWFYSLLLLICLAPDICHFKWPRRANYEWVEKKVSQVVKQYCSKTHHFFCDSAFEAAVGSVSAFEFFLLLHGSLFGHLAKSCVLNVCKGCQTIIFFNCVKAWRFKNHC